MKYIFVTGGVASSLGKGLIVSSLGAVLEARGFKISLQKIDPYLNIDAGTMNPYEHGEVYVTEDGGEADLDLGNYERFTHLVVTKNNIMTTGLVYDTVIKNERQGDYLGKTVQIIPHITDEIKRRIKQCAAGADIAIIEVGGTVGDIESIPFLEAIRQLRREEGRHNVAYVHLTLVPYLMAAEEIKSKPTQHSVRELRAAGINPTAIVCRSALPLSDELKRKIALFCDVDDRAVISAYNTPSTSTIYDIPQIIERQGLDEVLLEALKLTGQAPKANLEKWHNIVGIVTKKDKPTVTIALVGKYVAHKDAYKSVNEALYHAAITNKVQLNLVNVSSEELEADNNSAAWQMIKEAQGILVPGGFGERGIEGNILAIKYAREFNIPFFGICLGMQCMAIEFARNVLGIAGANSLEFNKNAQQPVITMMEEQKKIAGLGGTMRLGSYSAALTAGSLAFKVYGRPQISERHRHRYEFNNSYRTQFEEAGFVFSGINEQLNLVEIMELPSHKFFIAGQFHPEFKSKPFAAHPLFNAFVKAAVGDFDNG
ncbi:MAG: CTP synthase [Spirochaetaceae bacterium]|nr:CTP synthase [Spirochaetaceae bacterium]